MAALEPLLVYSFVHAHSEAAAAIAGAAGSLPCAVAAPAVAFAPSGIGATEGTSASVPVGGPEARFVDMEEPPPPPPPPRQPASSSSGPYPSACGPIGASSGAGPADDARRAQDVSTMPIFTLSEDDKTLDLGRCALMSPIQIHNHKNLLVGLASECKIEISAKGMEELTWDLYNYVGPRERFICPPRFTSNNYQAFMPPRFRPPEPVSAASDVLRSTVG